MPYVEESINTEGGARLYVRRRQADTPRGEVILVHGFGEHSGRYAAISDHLVKHGFNVTSYDQRGHGQSDGLPGHIDRFKYYEDDLDRIVSSVRSRWDARNLFIIGHSLGGLVTLRYLAMRGSSVTGAVLSAPLISVAVEVPAHKVMMARVGARLMPKLRLDNEIDPAHLSRDPEVGIAYANDPLVNRLVSAKWFAEATKAMQEVVAWAGDIKTPMLVMHGTEDMLASVEATKALFEAAGSSDKEMVILPGFYHELFNEPEKQSVYKRVSDWLEAHLRR
jgi:alpha-beta hydrolase superfamily lysophospholipase